MKLPSDALIAMEKLTNYLLVKRPVGDKSEFLRRAGYALDNWRQLEQDIRQQILPQEAVPVEQTRYGGSILRSAHRWQALTVLL